MSNTFNHSSARAMIENKRKRRSRNKTILVIGIVIGLVVLVGGIVRLFELTQPGKVKAEFNSEDIVQDQPFLAVHEMVAFDPNSIPFLPEDGPQPKIAFSEIDYDFGVIGLRDVVSKAFIIANTGDAPLTISRAYTTCGCTTVEISSRVIPPGKAVTANLIFDAGYHETGGQTVRRGLILETNDPKFPRSEIWTRATVRTTP